MTCGTNIESSGKLIGRLPGIVEDEVQRESAMGAAFEVFGRGGDTAAILSEVNAWVSDATRDKLELLRAR